MFQELTVWINNVQQILHPWIVDVSSDVEVSVVLEGKRPTSQRPKVMMHILYCKYTHCSISYTIMIWQGMGHDALGVEYRHIAKVSKA